VGGRLKSSPGSCGQDFGGFPLQKKVGVEPRTLQKIKMSIINPKRILIVQLRRIGDVLMCTPAIRALRKEFPESFISFLTEKESEPILRFNPYLNEKIVLDRKKYGNFFYLLKTIKNLRRKNFDLAIDFFGNPRSAYFTFLSGAKTRLGFDLPRRRVLYNILASRGTSSEYAALSRLKALKPLGIEYDDFKLDFFLSDEARSFAEQFFQKENLNNENLKISISPASRRKFNFYSLDRYAQICDWLIQEFAAEIILVWGPGEEKVVQDLSSKMRNKPIISPHTPSLLELGAVLERCDLHIGNDNGTKHIATAVGKPTFTIYGPNSPLSWTFPDPLRHSYVKKEVDCSNCENEKHKCENLECLDYSVDEVKTKIREFLGSLNECSVPPLAGRGKR
jgi:ADP-heptose:LPS heptosyltransferase